MSGPLLMADAHRAREGGADRPIVEVAVGVLIRPDGDFLLTSRPEGKVYAGYWEFPGGKLETGESVAAALARELHEDVGAQQAEAAGEARGHHVLGHAVKRKRVSISAFRPPRAPPDGALLPIRGSFRHFLNCPSQNLNE